MSGILDLCAIDAGQSNTRFLVFDEGREILAGDTSRGVVNILLSGAKEALRENLAIILQNVRRDLGSDSFRMISVGYTGISAEREEYNIVLSILEGFFTGSRIKLESDIVASHAANFRGKPGVVLHAGTGAFAYGVDSRGECMRTGGWGYLLGDEGSGFGLGLQAVRAALRAWEKTAPKTSLTDELLAFFEIDDPQTLKTVVYSQSFQRRRIADFARILLEHADRGDLIARQIVSAGAVRMVELVEPIVTGLRFEHPEAALVGALFVNSRMYFEKTRALLREGYGDRLDVRLGEKSSLPGALWIGLNALNADDLSRRR
jgi:N-acetylglucosamine kinase-like BadF-type ATPase